MYYELNRVYLHIYMKHATLNLLQVNFPSKSSKIHFWYIDTWGTFLAPRQLQASLYYLSISYLKQVQCMVVLSQWKQLPAVAR